MRKAVLTIAVLVTLALIAAILWHRHAAIGSALAQSQRQCEELRSQLEARDRVLVELRSVLERSPPFSSPGSTVEPGRRSIPANNGEIELARRLAELAVLQSNTLILIERLTDRLANVQPAETPQQKQAGVAALEMSVTEFQQKVEASRQRAADLLVGLNIPAEISTMDPAKALATASLKPYWPFFEALREREHTIFLLEKLQARLLQEQLDARAAAEKARAQ